LIALAALALCAAFFLTGQLGSPLPAFGVAVVVGALALVLPLRRYTATWPAVLVSWTAVSLVMLFLEGATVVTHQWARFIFASLILVAATWYLIRRASATAKRSAAAAAIAPAAIGAACLIGYTAVSFNPLHLLPELLAWVPTTLLIAAASAWLFALLTVIVVGAVDGASTPMTPVTPLLSRISAPTRKTPSGGLIEQIGTTFENVALYVLYLLAQAGVMAANLAWFTLIVCIRRIHVALQRAWRLTVLAAHATAQAARKTGRVVLIPVLTLPAAGWLAVVFANYVTDYLISGTIQSLGVLGAAAILANVALFVTWASLSYGRLERRWAAASRSTSRTVRITAPYWLLVQAGGGWLVGIPAMLGYGRVHVGWITYTSTIVIAVTFGLHLVRGRGTTAEARKTQPQASRVGTAKPRSA
jgi:hypothetical protein